VERRANTSRPIANSETFLRYLENIYLNKGAF
jgi:hypothetical protein